jgi:polygalacturonase
MIDSTITGLNIKNTPVQCFSINNSENLTITSVKIDNSAGDVTNGGHNTDAFDVGSSTGITIDKATVYNQDDCLAVNSGQDITFSNGYCSVSLLLPKGFSASFRASNTHHRVATVSPSALSVAAQTTSSRASRYRVAPSSIPRTASFSRFSHPPAPAYINFHAGVRIKTVYGATGSVSDITYSDITLKNISKYGVVIEQDYKNGSPTGTPTSGVPIKDVTLKNVKGTVASSGTDIYVLCASCSNFSWSGVSVTGGKKSSKCKGVPSGASC